MKIRLLTQNVRACLAVRFPCERQSQTWEWVISQAGLWRVLRGTQVLQACYGLQIASATTETMKGEMLVPEPHYPLLC